VRRTAAPVAAGAALAIALAPAAGGQGSSPAPNANPCKRPELHLRCPDLVMRRAFDLHLRRSPRGRLVLAAANAIVNVGDGPMEIRGRRVREYHMAAHQVLRAVPPGRTRVEPARGRVDFYDTHGRGVYWKFRHAARFELWRLDADGRPVGRVRVGPKVHYCFRDLRRMTRPAGGRPYPRSPRARRFGACSTTREISRVELGKSVGLTDTYPSTYPQNSVSVTGLRGCFAYVQVADPEHLLWETHEANNASARTIRLPWRGTRLRGCPHVRKDLLPSG
jgi:hypothetical protein